MTDNDMANLSDWIGRSETAEDEVTGQAARRIAALLDQPPRMFSAGERVPGFWCIMLFGPFAPQSQLAVDGHPAKGQFLPPVPLPRRMFAGRRATFSGDIRIGDAMHRHSTIAAITPKEGRSGPMCFVTVRHEISGPRGLAIIEEQDIVYRSPPPISPAREERARRAIDIAASPLPAWTETVLPTPAMVFRYSAITFNAHRIHYDAPYTREVEGYAGLVVNGGLTALLLLDAVARHTKCAIRSAATRNLAPLFIGNAVTLSAATPDADGRLTALARDDHGRTAIEAQIELEAA